MSRFSPHALTPWQNQSPPVYTHMYHNKDHTQAGRIEKPPLNGKEQLITFHKQLQSAQTRTHNFDVSLYIQHQVLWLQVSVHDVLLVEVGISLHHTGSAEHGNGLIKTPSENHRDSLSFTVSHKFIPSPRLPLLLFLARLGTRSF